MEVAKCTPGGREALIEAYHEAVRANRSDLSAAIEARLFNPAGARKVGFDGEAAMRDIGKSVNARRRVCEMDEREALIEMRRRKVRAPAEAGASDHRLRAPRHARIDGADSIAPSHEEGSPEDAVDADVAAFVDFLHRDPTFVYLIQRESLGGGSRLTEFFGRLVDDALAAFTPAAELAGVSPERLVVDLVALCWYPFAHEHTLVSTLGMKPRDPAFLEEQKRHLGDLVRAMTPSRA